MKAVFQDLSITTEELKRIQAEERQAAEQASEDPKTCATALWELAKTDTSGGRAASALLLSLWNFQYKANMLDVITSLDIRHSTFALALLKHLGPSHHLERYLFPDQIRDVLEVWGADHYTGPGEFKL